MEPVLPEGAADPDGLSPEDRRGVVVVLVVIGLDLLGFGMILPSLAYFVHIFPVPEIARSIGQELGMRDVGAVFVGMVQAAYSAFQLVMAPLWGRLSDRVGRRPVLVTSMGGFTLAWMCFAFAPSLTGLLVARALAGAFGANVATAQAYMADLFPVSRRAKAMGLIGMSFGLGFVLGPAIGALLSSDAVLGLFFSHDGESLRRAHLLIPGLFAATCSFGAFVLALFRLGESLPPERRAKSTRTLRGELRELVSALFEPGIGPMLVVYFVVVTGFASLEAMFSQFNYDRLHLGQSMNGLVFTAVGLTLAVVQGGLIGRLSARLGSPTVLIIGLAGLSVAMAAFGFQASWNPGISPVACLIGVSVLTAGFFSLCNPSVLALISAQARDRAQGGTMGFTASAATLGRVFGPLIGGVIYSAFGPEFPFAFGGLFVAVGLLLFVSHRRHAGESSIGRT
jgi:MFS family permease